MYTYVQEMKIEFLRVPNFCSKIFLGIKHVNGQWVTMWIQVVVQIQPGDTGATINSRLRVQLALLQLRYLLRFLLQLRLQVFDIVAAFGNGLLQDFVLFLFLTQL